MTDSLKSVLLPAAVCLGLFSCATPKSALNKDSPFTGSWTGKPSPGSRFSLDLKQQGDRLTGYHDAVTPQKSHRTDAVSPEEGPPSIFGRILDGTTARVTFQSGYSEEGKGAALLALKGGSLSWTILQSTGAHYLPESCVLIR